MAMKARDVKVGDIVSDKRGMWLAREVIPEHEGVVAIRLSPGREVHGDFYEIPADSNLEVWRWSDKFEVP